MSFMTETLLRRAASPMITLARQNARMTSADQRCVDVTNALPTSASVNDFVSRDKVKTISDLPGPNGYPVIGTALEYFRKENRGQMHEVQRRFHAKYGRIFKEKLGPVTNVSISDPSLLEELLRNEGKYPMRPPYEAWLLYKEMRRRSRGIISASGEEWRKIRTILNKTMAKPQHCRQYVTNMDQIAGELAEKLGRVRDERAADYTVPNVLNLLYAWAIESVGTVLVDERFGCLQHELSPQLERFVRAIEDMMYTGHQLMVFSNVHKFLNTKIWKTHVQAWDTIAEVAKDILDSKKAVIEERIASGDETTTPTIFEHFLANENLSMEEVYTNMAELLLSGVDTTSNTLSVAIYLLSEYPEVQDKLHDEISALETDGSSLTTENLKAMPYTKAVIKESLRLFPTAPINARVLSDDTTIGGHLIPKDTIVMLNTYTMSRNPEEFNRPDEFIPERWLRNEVREFSPFTSLPFGVGGRSCVGRRVAEIMTYCGIVNIVKRYRLRPSSTSSEVKPFVRTVLTLGNDLPVEFHDR